MITHIGQRQNGIFKIMRQLVLDEGNIGEMCQMFYDILPDHFGEVYLYGDSTGKRRSDQTGETNYSVIFQHMKQYQAPIRMKVPEKNPAVESRINAVQLQLKNPEGLSGIEVDPTCVELLLDYEQVLMDHKGGIKKVSNRKDSYFRRTHSSDGVGYWIVYEEPVRRPGQREKRVVLPKPPGHAFAGRAS